MVTPAQFKARYPAFEAVPDATVQAVLDEVEQDLSACIPADMRDRAVMLGAAHRLSLAGYGAHGHAASLRAYGAQSFRSGTLSLSFASGGGGAASSGPWAGTPYGAELSSIIAAHCGGPLVTTNGGECYSGWAKDWPRGGCC